MDCIYYHRSNEDTTSPSVLTISNPAVFRSAFTTSRIRRRKADTTFVMKSPVVLILFTLFYAGPASCFNPNFAAASKTYGASTERATRLKVSSALTVPAAPKAHIQWLKDIEKKQHSHSRQPSNWQAGDISYLFRPHVEEEIEDIPLDLVTSFNDTTAKDAWASRYASVEALRQTFGRNKNVLWGDLDAVTTRRLYKTLLPRALLELYHCNGASSEDLAPLAYRARVAAKLYARERSTLPTRIGACLFDGVRQFKKYGSFQVTGMTYDQIWEKYAKQVMLEEDWADDQDLTEKICLKILERSCASNETVDRLLLGEDAHDLKEITRKLEKEVFTLLNDSEGAKRWAVQRYKTLKTLLRIRRSMELACHHEGQHHHHNHPDNHSQQQQQKQPEFAKTI